MKRIKMLTLSVHQQKPGVEPKVYIVPAQRQKPAIMNDGFKVVLYSHENILGDSTKVAVSNENGIKIAMETTLRKALKLARERLAQYNRPWYEARVKEILNA